MPKTRDIKDAPKGTLLHRKDGYRKILGNGGNVMVCHWCRKPRARLCRWVHWYENGEKRDSKLCSSCAAVVFVCGNCAAMDNASEEGGGVCCLNPPGEEGFPPVAENDRCLTGFTQAEPFTREELEELLKSKNWGRLS
jgi:hypothetical protein